MKDGFTGKESKVLSIPIASSKKTTTSGSLITICHVFCHLTLPSRPQLTGPEAKASTFGMGLRDYQHSVTQIRMLIGCAKLDTD